MAEEPYLKGACVVAFILIRLIYEKPETERWGLQGFFFLTWANAAQSQSQR